MIYLNTLGIIIIVMNGFYSSDILYFLTSKSYENHINTYAYTYESAVNRMCFFQVFLVFYTVFQSLPAAVHEKYRIKNKVLTFHFDKKTQYDFLTGIFLKLFD